MHYFELCNAEYDMSQKEREGGGGGWINILEKVKGKFLKLTFDDKYSIGLSLAKKSSKGINIKQNTIRDASSTAS